MILLRLLFGSITALLFAGCASPPPGPERGRAVYATCAPCHGTDGGGNRAYGAPAIAGLAPWYVRTQLEHFRNGARGAHPEDAAGLRMRSMVRALRSEEDVAAVADYVASMPEVRPVAAVSGGDPSRGRAVYATCAECHGQDAAGSEARNAPRLAGSSDWYLLAQLSKFREGVRGADPRDTTGATMRPMAMSLADEQAMRDVIAYVATLRGGAR